MDRDLTAEDAQVPAGAECLPDDGEPGTLPGAAIAISAAPTANQTPVQPYPAYSGIKTRFGNSQIISSRSGFSVGTGDTTQISLAGRERRHDHDNDIKGD